MTRIEPTSKRGPSVFRGQPRLYALLAAAVVFFIPFLGLRPLVSPDEFRYAEIPREMIASANWTVPRLDGVLYFEKPVLGYWMTAASIQAFGENAFAVRLPSALSTLLAAAILFGLVRRFGPGNDWALAAVACFLTSVGVAVLGTTALLDAPFALGITATLAAFFVASQQPPGRGRQIWLAGCGIACGAAFLIKGFLAFAIPAVVAVPFLVWSRRPGDLLRLPWTPLAAATITIAPWAIAITAAEPDFWSRFVLDEHLRRFAGGQAAPHPQPFWFYLPVLLVGALPWTFLAPFALRRIPDLSREPLARFAVCWFAGPLALFSISSGKLLTYVLPCFAPLFILVACGFGAMPPERLRAQLGRLELGVGATCGVGALALVAADAFYGLDPWFSPGELWKVHVAGAGLVLTSLVAAAAYRPLRAQDGIAATGATILMILVLTAVVFPTGDAYKTPGRFLAERVDPVAKDAIVIAERSLVQAVSWHLRRDDIYVIPYAGELTWGLKKSGEQDRVVDWTRLEEIIRDPTRTRPVVVIGRIHRSELPVTPTPIRQDRWQSIFFAQYEPLLSELVER